jgi:serine/threonine protein kinase
MSVKTYELLDKGYTATVFRLPGTRRVCKSFLSSCANTNFPVEVQAYERFTACGHPATILKYYGLDKDDPTGIVLELAENGSLHDYLWDSKIFGNSPSRDTLYRWARQAAEALAFAHSCGVFHSDIHCVNFLLDENLDLKVADFAGASIDGGTSWSSYRLTHRLFDAEGNDNPRMGITTATEIFGLGSALYYMVTGHDLFPELDYTRDRAEIVRRLQERKFPDTSELPVLGSVITKCWNLQYYSMADVIEGIDAESR